MRLRIDQKTILLSAALASASACGGDDGANEPGPADAAVADAPVDNNMGPPDGHACDGIEADLGTGAREFEPVTDGQTVYLYRGPQGGYMIYLSVRAKGLDPSDVYFSYEETFDDTGEKFGWGTWRVRLTNDLGDGRFERVGIWGEVEPEWWTRPGSIRGRDATVAVTLTDAKGCSISGLGWSIHISEDPGM
jgi:hypothetical protein